MCGIAGLWNLNGEPVSPEALRCFIDSLAHRGPDGSDIYIDPTANLGLGHRRLAIIDTSDGGRQPMPYAEGRYWIVFNGEMYDFLELKSELEKLGYEFKTESDTEVILTAYHHWGEDCQLKFNGMWALAIWDSAERRLFVLRDRFGVKPMIYHFDANHFAFASEMKAFLELDWFQLDFDRLSMAHGVEVRSPFMDWRLACFVFSLPSSAKIGSGFTKRILRDALKDILPESIRTRTRKLGFPNLAEAWTSPRAQDFIRDVIHSADFQQSAVWDGKIIAEDLAVAIRKQDNDQLHQAWIYVQAASLIRLFGEKRRVHA